MAIEPLSDREQQLATQVTELKRELAALQSRLSASLEALARAAQTLKSYEHDVLRAVDHDAVARLNELGSLYFAPPWPRNTSILGGFSASRACPPVR